MSTPPQRSQLPRSLDPRRLANQGEALSGQVPVSLCERLQDAVLRILAPIDVNLRFEHADQGRKVVAGHAETTVEVACQRCLEPMSQHLDATIYLGIVWSEDEAKSLPRDMDPWIVEDETADLSAMIEDELLLVLPFVTFHPEGTCEADGHFSVGEAPAEEQEQQDNPFSILEQLKNSGSNH